ncbi:BTB/POZ domain-containing protein KCTD11 [Carettochelys insculpta]|uniref:BTB/POZ domain-containing protein KCTD11 n=1 Tax=Carettochelys insculpta TaxID=44489 RepID=UPI003EBD98A3
MGEEDQLQEAPGKGDPAGASPRGLPLGPITLNVGGTVYTTTLETLTRFPDSMLGAMFRDPRPACTDHRGHYFIDRDGKAFRHVLNFLRQGRLELPEVYPELGLLQAEAGFYQIQPLLAELGRLAAERRRRRAGAVLHVDVAACERLLHFTVRRGPHNYGLSTCPLRVFSANVFCTDGALLDLLRGRLGADSPGEEPGAAGGPHRLQLEWAPRPPELPEAEYAKQKARPLRTAPPEGRELATAGDFLEEVLKVALDQGFRVDSVFPDPADILNSHSLRLVRL